MGNRLVDVSPTIEPARRIEANPPRLSPAVLLPLVALLVVWLLVMVSVVLSSGGPNARSFGGDFAMFYAAAHVAAHGGNPYDGKVLYSAERSVLRDHQGIRIPARSHVRVGSVPLLFWALQPLTKLPYRPVAAIWMLVMWTLSAVGFFMAARYLGWSRLLTPCLLFLAMPQVVSGVFYGNLDGLVFAGIALSLLMLRRYPFLAGLTLGVAWLKPQIALPIVLLIGLFHAPSRTRTIAGFLSVTVALATLTIGATGAHSLSVWLQSLSGYSNDNNVLGDVAPLSGFYTRWVSSDTRLALHVLTLGVALIFTAVTWMRHRRDGPLPVLSIAWLWFVWFLAAPFGHIHDEILLAIPMLAFLGRDARNFTDPLRAIAVYVMFLSILLVYWTPLQTQLLWVPLAVVTACLYLASARTRSNAAEETWVTS